MISMIAAMGKNRVIGINNQLPWHLPADLAWFKKHTLKKPVIMGKNTFLSIGRTLPNRTNIIMSHHFTPDDKTVRCAHSLDEAISIANATGSDEIMIIGGESIFQQFLPLAERLYLTHVDIAIDGDTFFPDYSHYHWQQDETQYYPPDEKNPYACQFESLSRLPDA